MIITLKGANFSTNNINDLLNSYSISYYGNGVSGSPSSVAKDIGGDLTCTLTIAEGYTYKSLSVSVGGVTLNSDQYEVIKSGNKVIIYNANITGNIMISVVTEGSGVVEPEEPTSYTFTINPDPTSATVTLSATGYTTVSGTGSKSITVANGTEVNWTVSADGYTTRTGNWTISGGNKTENITLTANSGAGDNELEAGTHTYNNSGYIAAATGKVVAGGTWIHSDFIPVAQLANGDDGKCVRTFTGHGTVAAIAFYRTKDNFDSWVSSIKTGDITDGATSVTAEYVKSLAPAEGNYVVFSTDGSKQTLSVTVGNGSGGGSSEPEEPDTPVISGLNYYDEPGFISISTGQVTNPTSTWIHSDFIAIDSLVDDAELGHCIGKCTGHASVADIAFYSAANFSSFIVGKSSAGATKTVAALQNLMTELNATNATHIIISTDKTRNQLYASLK